MKTVLPKRILALLASAALASVPAFAQDLAQYPAPFIADGAFDGIIVVGEKAKTSDVVGAIELAASLQAAAIKTTAIGVPLTAVDKGVKIDRTGYRFGAALFMGQVQDTPLDAADLPGLLADGTFDEDEGATSNKVGYDQQIVLSNASGRNVVTQDDDDAPTFGGYIYFPRNTMVYNYTLDFDEDVSFDNTSSTTINDDFETAKLTILGKDYTITDAESVSTSNSAIGKLTFLAGETTRWLIQDEPLTREIAGAKHTFVLADVNENEDKCGISVDGTVQWIDIGQTRTVGGLQIGVTDAIVVHSAGKDTDVCEVNLGATELVLEDGQEVRINGVDLDGSEVDIESTGDALRSISIWYDMEDDFYLPEGGQRWIEPIFDSFAFLYQGPTKEPAEVMTVAASGDAATLTFLNNDKKEVTIEWAKNDSNVIVLGSGSAADERIYLEGQACPFTAVSDCEGARFLRVTSGGEAHLLEILDFDTTDDTIKLKDETYGSTSEDDFDDTATTAQAVDLSSGAGSITLTLTNSSGGAGGTLNRLNFTDISGATYAETSLNDEGGVHLNTSHYGSGAGGAAELIAFSYLEESDDGYGGVVFQFNLSFDSTDDDIDIEAPIATTGMFLANGDKNSVEDDEHKWYVTAWTTSVFHDDEDKDSATIYYFDNYRYAEFFVGEAEAKLSTTGAQTTEVQKISVGTAMLDKDVADWKAQNTIAVGGPCANTVAAAALDNPAPCTSGFVEGEGMITLVANDGKYALVVAGYTALDTRKTTKVLSNYKDYASALKGTSVKVLGSTLADVSVAPA
ncbi:hypothetical protein HY493_01315 [Candidatus Woesearchaeota archaeon]|nr:hypothetical protein [Candidatus Woesearchaeota archaeon]